MSLFCPTCHAPSAGGRCLHCGGRTTKAATRSSAVLTPSRPADPPDLIPPTAPYRTAIGCLVALGLYLGLREWVAVAASDPAWWVGPAGIVLTILLRAIGVSVGGLVAGAGRDQGARTGAAVGVLCGVLFLIADELAGADVAVVGAAVGAALMLLAAATGRIGSRLWPPAMELPEPPTDPQSSSLVRLARKEKREKTTSRTAWAQVLTGTAIVLFGIVSADALREGMKWASAGMLNLGGPRYAPLADLQLAILIVILGAAAAGANTKLGLRQGFLVGVLAVAGVACLSVAGLNTLDPVAEGLFQLLNLPLTDPTGQTTVIALLILFVLCVAGGWFGSQLLPPLAPAWMRTRLAPAS
jgi:hypothetical protein